MNRANAVAVFEGTLFATTMLSFPYRILPLVILSMSICYVNSIMGNGNKSLNQN